LIHTEAELDEALSRPTKDDVAAMAALAGDVLILGAAGKMGPSLAALARRASEAAGVSRGIIGVSRFSSPDSRQSLEAAGVETIACDLLDRNALAQLPDCPNVLFMAGRKFGTHENEALTWAINTYLPALVAERFPRSHIVAFSTANVYPLSPIQQGGSRESDAVSPVGDYAQSALGRERLLQYFSERNGTPMAILRLSYAIDLRYGVLRDVAEKIVASKPVDLTTGYANVIWQRDANSVALRAFAHCASPALVLNLSGPRPLSIRQAAERMGEMAGVDPVFAGQESDSALLVNCARAVEMFGPPPTSTGEMIEWVTGWVQQGGRSLHKPTHFEERTGQF
jgi:nucleoside-diphosphate-sugar epimerase